MPSQRSLTKIQRLGNLMIFIVITSIHLLYRKLLHWQLVANLLISKLIIIKKKKCFSRIQATLTNSTTQHWLITLERFIVGIGVGWVRQCKTHKTAIASATLQTHFPSEEAEHPCKPNLLHYITKTKLKTQYFWVEILLLWRQIIKSIAW